MRIPRYWLSIPRIWVQHAVHNSWGILTVLDIVWLRPMKGGLYDTRHPYCTGIDPQTGRLIWNANLIFRTPRRADLAGAMPIGDTVESDEEIIDRVGRHMRSLARQVASSAEAPYGRPHAFPPGILYIHGCVHYNCGWLLFNDFEEAIEHFSDPRFVRELRRFIRTEKREVVTVFRQRDYDPQNYLDFVCFSENRPTLLLELERQQAARGVGQPVPVSGRQHHHGVLDHGDPQASRSGDGHGWRPHSHRSERIFPPSGLSGMPVHPHGSGAVAGALY